MIAARRVLARLAIAATLAIGGAGPSEAANAVRPASRGGSLLPQGSPSTRGSQIIDAMGQVVRIASVG